MRDAAHETGPELMLAHFDDDELEMRQGRRQARRGDDARGSERPVATPGQASGKDAHVVGQVGDGERRLAQVFERRRGMKRRQNPSLAFGDQPQGREMRLARPIDGGDDGFADQRHGLTRPRRASAACGPPR